MSTNKAIIIIPITGEGTEVVTNGVNLLTIINVLKSIESGFCKRLVMQAQSEVGNNREAILKRLDQMIKQAAREEGRNNSDGLKGSDILGLN